MHRIETIMARIEALAGGLATTGANVFRGRSEPLSDRPPTIELPGLLIGQGADEVLENHSGAVLLCGLEVGIDLIAGGAEPLDPLLNQIRAELTVALQADHTLGLGFVRQIEELGAAQPEHDSSGDRPLAQQRTLWRVIFDRGRSDPAN